MLTSDVSPLQNFYRQRKMTSGDLRSQLILARVRAARIAASNHYSVLGHLLEDWGDLSNRLTSGHRYLISIETLSPPLR